MRQARADAEVELPFDEQQWIRMQAEDRMGVIPPWNRGEALERLTAERLEKRDLGNVTAERDAQLRGYPYPAIGIAREEAEERKRLEWNERQRRLSESLEETDRAYARAKAADEEEFRKTGRRRLR